MSKVFLFIIMFLLIGAFFIVSSHKLALANSSARVEFGNLYLNWAGQLFDNSRGLVGYVVKMDWLPRS